MAEAVQQQHGETLPRAAGQSGQWRLPGEKTFFALHQKNG